MSPEEAVMLALTTGAAARMRPNNWALKRPEVEAYMDVVDLLQRRFSTVDARMMEVGPGSRERQQLLTDQIRKSGAAENRAVLRRSRRVLQEVLARTPHAIIAAYVEVSPVTEALSEIENILEIRQRNTRQHA